LTGSGTLCYNLFKLIGHRAKLCSNAHIPEKIIKRYYKFIIYMNKPHPFPKLKIIIEIIILSFNKMAKAP